MVGFSKVSSSRGLTFCLQISALSCSPLRGREEITVGVTLAWVAQEEGLGRGGMDALGSRLAAGTEVDR